MRLEDTALYQRLSDLATTDRETRTLLGRVESVFAESVDLARSVIRVMPEYTLHDEVHLIAVVDLMGRVIPPDLLHRLGPLEIASLILAGGMHDLGMAPPAQEVNALLAGLTEDRPNPTQADYLRFRLRSPELIKRKDSLAARGRIHEAHQVELYLLAEYLRRTHGKRTYAIIHEHFADRCRYGDLNFTNQIARVCRSHTEESAVLDTLNCYDLVRAGGERCNWRFIAVVLRLADILDFDPKRTPDTLFRHLGIRTPVSVAEWKKHQRIKAWAIGPGEIVFRADCEDPVIQETILDFIRLIDAELKSARSTLGGMHHPQAPNLVERYHLDLPAEVDASQVGPVVGPDGPIYTYLPVRFRLDHEAVVNILMGVALYGERHLFLRELLQNAVDACRHRLAAGHPGYRPEVLVRLVTSEDGSTLLFVEDNGMGMSQNIVEQYFARIGRSYYRSPDFAQEHLPNAAFRPISQFGIGVLSAFMAGDHIQVETLRAEPGAEPLWIEIANQGSLFWFKRSHRPQAGTSLSIRLTRPTSELLLQPEHAGVPAPHAPVTDLQRLVRTVSHLAPHIEFPVVCEADGLHTQLVTEYEPPPFPAWPEVHLRVFELNLSAQAIKGLEGQLRFALLVDEDAQLLWDQPGKGAMRGPNGSFEFAPDHGAGEWWEVAFGGIQRTRWVMQGHHSRGGQTDYVFEAIGKVSQQGFLVPHPLFSPRYNPPKVALPFPVMYDVNLSEPFRLPLTADRTKVIEDDSTRAIYDALTREITSLMLREITPIIRNNPAYFRRLADRNPGQSAIYRELLAELLA